MVPTPHTRHVRVTGFERGRNGRDLKRPIVEPMAPDDVVVGQFVRRRRGSWRGDESQDEHQAIGEVGHDKMREREMRAGEREADVLRGREALYCMNRRCNGTRSEKRVKGPDGPGTLCGGCYFHYFSCKWLLCELEGKDEYSIVPRDGWRLVRVMGYEQEVAGGRRDLMRPIVEKITEGGGIGWGIGEDGLVWVKCLRCGERGAGWMGPDGGGTLCEGCWGVYAGGGMVLWREGGGRLSVAGSRDGDKVVVIGWRNEGENIDYRNPVVVGYKRKVEVGGVAERELRRVERPKSEPVEEMEESKIDVDEESTVEVIDEGKGDVIDEGETEVTEICKVEEVEEDNMIVDEVAMGNAKSEANGRESAEVHVEVEEEVVEEGNGRVEAIGGIYVKVEYNKELRRSRIGMGLSYRGFRREIRKIVGVNGTFSVAYRDDEGDFVTVGTERDLVEMYHLVRRFRMEPLYLRVRT